MTESQKAILDRLSDEDMRVTELCEELHMVPSVLRKILNNMEKSNWIKKNGSYYSIVIDYAPKLDWNFKPLLGAWK
jgi:DNA-binding IclR family transcriptional regulator